MTDLSFQRELVVTVAVVGGQGRAAGHIHETTVNTGCKIAVVGQGHVIDLVGRGHVIEVNTDPGHIHENVAERKINVIAAVLTTKNDM